MHTSVYSNSHDATSWNGVQLVDGSEFDAFMEGEVASRLHDKAGKADFTSHLNSLASTGFAQDSLQAILEAEHPEERDWAVGEALAEAWLSREHGVVWPWNMERDKRTPLASLPGADLVGFVTQGSETRLVLGEVKSSSDSNAPPNVMTGRHGMTRQLETLVTDIGLLYTLIRWLQPRCRGNDSEPHFNAAIGLLLQSGNKAMTLFGVLVRDTQPDERDLRNRGQHLGGVVNAPAGCHLLALHLPCSIASLPDRVQGGVS
ncbi:conserved protein of unknown function [Acidithiobacillus ferrivorans]|uniref:Uncharacterized protein n=1 Tax=Acidithiobacillus ferrivorans TaxID=160808 RepID=A0A060USI8_9PROT|nr:hypothetical protein [Acidithiobacillus ferrivorans]CDQ09489.1 conserved hypothetical protein [Acidithiobacillus ferrivorans]SMH67263.1 conserved protein of unknown function [Acidithiobacillus ferrivorans]